MVCKNIFDSFEQAVSVWVRARTRTCAGAAHSVRSVCEGLFHTVRVMCVRVGLYVMCEVCVRWH